MSGDELPKVIDKSQADIEAAIAAIKTSNIPNGTKEFAISCIRLAANGDVLHNDDSHVKITDIIRHNRLHPNKERTGAFTTGFISRTKERDIALFYNGSQHAGENM